MIVVLTGAGISAESGLKTFRDSNGLWENHRVEDVATPEAFESNPKLVYDFYNLRRRQVLDPTTLPNAAHLALAHLEQKFQKPIWIITQNVDPLHERAGSKNVIHMHGELLKVRCLHSERIFSREEDLSIHSQCECCGIKGALRPHIVWFGEIPLYLDKIHSLLMQCELFVSVGTSGQVYPAAGFIAQVQANGSAKTLELNMEKTELSSLFDEGRYGPAGTIVPQWVGEALRVGV